MIGSVLLGNILAVTASTLVTAKDVVSKRVSSSVSSGASTFASFAYPLPLYIFILIGLASFGISIFETSGKFWEYALARAITDTGAEWCKMAALATGELSVVTSIFALYPLLLLLSAPWITGDALEPGTPLSMVVIVIGTLVVLYRPRGEQPIRLKTILLSLAAAVFFSLNTALDRAAVQNAHPVFSAFVMTLFSAIIIGCSLKRHQFSEVVSERKFFALRGVFEVLFMSVKLSALTILSAPLVVGIGRISIVFNVLAGYWFFGERHVGRKLLGALIIVLGVAYLLIQQQSPVPHELPQAQLSSRY